MADDDDGTPPEEPKIDRDTLKALIREVLDEDVPDAPDPDDDGDPDDRPLTVADLEAATEKAMRNAMKVLADAQKKKPPVKKDSGDKPEPTPTPPVTSARDFRSTLRKILVGADD